MTDPKFSDKSVMWTLLTKLTVGGMFEDMAAKKAYETVQELLLADEAFDKAWKEFSYRGNAIVDVDLAKIRRAAAMRACRDQTEAGHD